MNNEEILKKLDALIHLATWQSQEMYRLHISNAVLIELVGRHLANQPVTKDDFPHLKEFLDSGLQQMWNRFSGESDELPPFLRHPK